MNYRTMITRKYENSQAALKTKNESHGQIKTEFHPQGMITVMANFDKYHGALKHRSFTGME